ncbi:MAG: signal peptidase I [Bacilli bacterium]|nr:signal peptidase I [Bacilli bacterium]
MNEKVKKIIHDFAPLVLIVIGVLLIKHFIVTPVQVKGDSMYPTLKDGDIMILNKIGLRFSEIERFDIVVIKHNKTLLIKRVIGLPGDNIKYINNVLYINNKQIKEDFLDNETTEDFEYNVEENCYFALGDNRDVSLDSRVLGCFDKSEIEGKTSLTLFPFSRIGTKK